MALASGRRTQHHLIANSTSLRNFAAAVLSSVSSQLSSTSLVAGTEHHHHQRRNFYRPEEASSPIVAPSSSEDDNPQHCAHAECYSDEASGSGRVHSMAASVLHYGRNSPPRSRQFHVHSFSSSRGLRQCMQSSRGCSLQEPEFEICDDGRNSRPSLRQFHGQGISSSRGSRQCMQSSTGWSLQEPEFEIYEGRLHVKELPRVRIWHSARRFHMQHAHHHHEGGPDKSGKANERILGWGLWGDIGLAVGKGGAGYVSGSTALIADAAHSVSDVALSAVALWTSKVAHTPKDKEHPYGHGKYETVGALGISGMLLVTGGAIAWHAVETLQPFIPMISDWAQTATGHSHEHVHGGGHHHGIDLQHPYVALTAAVVSIGVKETLFQRTKKIGEEQHSELLKASAWHHRSDAISSIVALLGIGGAVLGMPLLDPVAGLVVSGMIMKAGCETGYQSLQDLVDSGVQESVLSPIRRTVLHVEGVEGCHHLRGRRMGSFIHIDAHIEVDPWLSVSAAHNIAEAVRHDVHSQHPEVAETFVHIEPADGGTKTLTHAEAEHEHELHDHNGEAHKHPDINEESFNRKDLTDRGSKSDLLKSSHTEECVDDSFSNGALQHPRIDQDVRAILGANFQEKMTINHVTSHFVQGRVVIEVEVSMNPEISVRIAMDRASEAERAILRKVTDISAVRVQLKLTESSSQSK